MNKSSWNFNKIKTEFEVIANSILNEKGVEVFVNVDDSHESYTYMKNPRQGQIQIGLGVLPNGEFSTKNRLRAQGLLYHEIGHLLYTQFEPIEVIVANQKEAKNLVNEILASKREDLKAWDMEVCSNLKSSLKEDIFWHEMKTVLNMLEDAAVEVLMPASSPYKRSRNKIFASISAMRDYQWEEKDLPGLRRYKYDGDDSELLKMALYEVHQFGVIGYRTTTTTKALECAVEPEVIEELKSLAFQSKFMTSNTTERYSIAKLILKKFDTLLDKKASKFFDSLMEVINMSEEDVENTLSSMSSSGELGISMPNQTAASSSSQESEYQYDLSEEQKQEIAQQQEEDSKELNGADSADGSNSDSNSDDKRNSNDNFAASSETSVCNSSNEAPSNEPSSNEQSVNDLDSSDSDTANSSKPDETNSSSSNSNSSKKHLPSMQELNREIEKAIKSEEAKDASKKEASESQNLADAVKSHQKNSCSMKSGINVLEDYNTDFHRGIKTICDNVSNLDVCNFSDAGKSVYANKDALLPNIRHCANKINRIKMYSAKAKRLNAQRKGKLNTSGLYRIGIDQKVFQKTNPGKKQNFRIAFLIDESGSMSGSKIRNAIETAYILASACRYVKIPVSVWGHNIWCQTKMNLNKYLDFGDKSPNSLNKIFNADASGANHDGLAIWHVAKDLVAHRKSDEKLLLFILSDGAPAGANDYYGEPAEQDISHIVSLFKKEYGVESFGITIETSHDEVESCKRIYGDNAIYISNSKDLPKKTVELLESLYK